MDKATTAKTRVAYARICVRIKADEELPSFVTITDEFGVDINPEVHYEWVPPQCLRCKSFGHNCDEGDMNLQQEGHDVIQKMFQRPFIVAQQTMAHQIELNHKQRLKRILNGDRDNQGNG